MLLTLQKQDNIPQCIATQEWVHVRHRNSFEKEGSALKERERERERERTWE